MVRRGGACRTWRPTDARIRASGDVAQLGERRVRNAKVGSSILLVSTRTTIDRSKGLASAGRLFCVLPRPWVGIGDAVDTPKRPTQRCRASAHRGGAGQRGAETGCLGGRAARKQHRSWAAVVGPPQCRPEPACGSEMASRECERASEATCRPQPRLPAAGDAPLPLRAAKAPTGSLRELPQEGAPNAPGVPRPTCITSAARGRERARLPKACPTGQQRSTHDMQDPAAGGLTATRGRRHRRHLRRAHRPRLPRCQDPGYRSPPAPART